MIREVPGIEDLLLSKLSGDEEALSHYWADDGSMESPLELWKKSRVVKELDRVLPILESLTKKKKRTWEESECPPASQNQVIPDPQPVQTAVLPSRKEDEPIGAAPTDPTIVDLASSARPPQLLCGSSNDWALPSSAGRLVEAYFSYTHTWFPIIERHDMLRALYQGPKSKVTRSPGEIAALWAVLAYAEAQYAIISGAKEVRGLPTSADLFYDRAKSLVSLVDGEYELGHVQAVLILAVLKVGQDDWKSAWILVGHSVRIAMSLGLDLIPPNTEQSKLPVGARRGKHVFLGCFVLDTITAARFGRLPHLRSRDAENVGAIDEEGLEEWDHWNDCLAIRKDIAAPLRQAMTLSAFNNLVVLTQILSDIICHDDGRKAKDYSSGGSNATDGALPGNESAGFFNGITARLDSWKSIHGSVDEDLNLPSHCNLYLFYLSITMTLNLRYPSITPLVHLGQNTIRWLKLCAEKFGLSILPPIFEYSLKLAGDCITHSLNAGGAERFNDMDWAETWGYVTSALSRGWPVFQLSIALSQSHTMAWNKQDITKVSAQHTASMFSTTPSRPQSARDLRQAPQFATPKVFLETIETTPRTFRSPSGTQRHSQARFDSSHHMDASLDQDSIFSEFDAMDANLWSNTWEQSLLNLGYTTGDGQNIDEEFYSFFGTEGNKPDNAGVLEQRLSNGTP